MLRAALAISLCSLTTPVFADATPAALRNGHGAQIHDSRFVLIEGTRNFRDMGGLRTVGGKTVKPGLFYRSGPLGSMTDKGRADFARLHVARIVDLRTTAERAQDAYDQKREFGGVYWTRDYGMSMGDMRSLFSDPSKLNAENMRAMMVMAYRKMPKEQAPAYRELFASLLAGSGPVVVNCTAGKDRTGIAAALVLTALGVPYDAVKQDFLLSNGAPGMDSLQATIPPALARLPAEVRAPLTGVEGAYLDAAFDQLRKDYGSIESYLDRELQVGPEQIRRLRARMLV